MADVLPAIGNRYYRIVSGMSRVIEVLEHYLCPYLGAIYAYRDL